MASACPQVTQVVQSVVDTLTRGGGSDWGVLQIDFSNAFNSVTRSSLLKEVALRCPKAWPWLASTYSYHSPLYVGDTTILSQRGLQQGDLCGPAGFCWAVQGICEHLQRLVECQAWYLGE